MSPTSSGMDDLAIIIISTNEARWLVPCLSTVFEHAGGATLDVVVVDNSSTDGTRELVESKFPEARVVTSANHGFGHANNRGAETCSARYVLFLNPDTEVVAGTFGELVAAMDERPDVGLIGARQITADGELWPTIRRFPSFLRALAEALGSEKWPFSASWYGERELDLTRYEQEVECDWTSGSFMLVRREALLSGGMFDERMFIYSEDPDIALRIKQAGWQVRHMPNMTIIHHAAKGGVRPKMVAQDAFSRLQYARKHFSLPYRWLYMMAVALGYVLRGLFPRGERRPERRKAARLALSTLGGRTPPPFGRPPATALPEWPRLDSWESTAIDGAAHAAVAGSDRSTSGVRG